MKPHRGVLILILGILGFVLCGPFTAIPAWIMGNGDIKQMNAGTMDPSGRGMTNAGRILGMIETLLLILAFLAAIAFFMLSFSSRSTPTP
jgi:hypothetical protein